MLHARGGGDVGARADAGDRASDRRSGLGGAAGVPAGHPASGGGSSQVVSRTSDPIEIRSLDRPTPALSRGRRGDAWSLDGGVGCPSAAAQLGGSARRVGWIRMLARLSSPTSTGVLHVRAKHGVHSRLVSGPLSSEPVEHIRIDAKRNRLLRHRLNHFSRRPEAVREAPQLTGRRALDLRFRDSA